MMMSTVPAGSESTIPSQDEMLPAHRHRQAKSRELRKARKALAFLSDAQRMVAHYPYSPTRTHTEIFVLRKGQHHYEAASYDHHTCVGDVIAHASLTASTTPSLSTVTEDSALPLSPTSSAATRSLSEDERCFAPKCETAAAAADTVTIVVPTTTNRDLSCDADEIAKRERPDLAFPLGPVPQQQLEQQRLNASALAAAAADRISAPPAATLIESFYYRVVPYEHGNRSNHNNNFPGHVASVRPLIGPTCVKVLSHCIRLKIGGVCCDLSPGVVASFLQCASGGTVIEGIDMFRALHGCCSVWVATPADAAKIRNSVHHQLWSGSQRLNCAVLCSTTSAAGHLSDHLRSAHLRFGTLPFPTHLMTVEPWQPTAALRKLRAHTQNACLP